MVKKSSVQTAVCLILCCSVEALILAFLFPQTNEMPWTLLMHFEVYMLTYLERETNA